MVSDNSAFLLLSMMIPIMRLCTMHAVTCWFVSNRFFYMTESGQQDLEPLH